MVFIAQTPLTLKKAYPQPNPRVCPMSTHILERGLLFGEVFPHIQRAGRENDCALDDVLHVRVDAEHGQRNEDDTQDEHAEDDAADLAGAPTNETPPMTHAAMASHS